MTQDYKQKFPIGSQWKCRDGSITQILEYDLKNERIDVVNDSCCEFLSVNKEGLMNNGEFEHGLDLIKKINE